MQLPNLTADGIEYDGIFMIQPSIMDKDNLRS
eukprot:CAMPEP_0178996244 /NCGR_PEP_ID=MMETSP0795-20121207/8270_1 /TAXON_ID=88552 /ORGANISM="Amoebophrya sp., Strain Ameob2" /LENGTH=31 /DNA_ID= /DNA_START= /DNA_END= /DNA_ORIENTATION=